MSTDMNIDDPTDPIEIIEENEAVFETIRTEADDPLIAERFGGQPLDLLELDRKQGGQP